MGRADIFAALKKNKKAYGLKGYTFTRESVTSTLQVLRKTVPELQMIPGANPKINAWALVNGSIKGRKAKAS